MKRIVIYVHGKGGNADECRHYNTIFADSDVVGMDYSCQTPWDAKVELPALFDKLTDGYDGVVIVANSIGAYFTMCALSDKPVEHAYFVSPIVDMERLILDMCVWAGVTETDLAKRGTIDTNFGETLSMQYLAYVRANPYKWAIPTDVLYGSCDNLTELSTITSFCDKVGATLTIMPDGEHWFHTDEQMSFLDNWLTNRLKSLQQG